MDLPSDWLIVPIHKGHKGWAHIRGWSSPRMTRRVLQEQAAKHPACNLGLRLDGFAAIDPDSQEAADFLDKLEKKGQFLPKTVSWKSASGRITRLYRIPPGMTVKPIPPESNSLYLELRTGRGHQCLIPPSVVIDKEGQERQYKWVNPPWDTDVAELPRGTLEAIQALVRPPAKTPTRKGKQGKAGKQAPIIAAPGSVCKPGRNSFLFRQGRALRGKGADYEEIEAALQEINQRVCVPPLPRGDVRRIARSCAKYPANARTDPSKLSLTYEQILTVMAAMGGKEQWIRRSLLIETLQAMTGSPGSITNPPVSLPTIERCLTRMVTQRPRLLSRKPGGFYKIPKRRERPTSAEDD
jgi:hypothetical protein